jgi:hypothetical protein
MTAGKKTGLVIVILALICGACWAASDLWGPRSTSLRNFDPEDVARRETEMWRSYYDKQRVRMFGEMADLLRHQYHLPLLRSYVVGFHAAKAAFIFKDGATRSDYEHALPELMDYYAALHRVSDTPFDTDKAAHLELEWWIIHRQPSGDLDSALADLASEIYQLPADRFREHAKFRAEAMTLRDQLDEQNGVSEADWQRINDLLLQSWRSLWNAVNGPGA